MFIYSKSTLNNNSAKNEASSSGNSSMASAASQIGQHYAAGYATGSGSNVTVSSSSGINSDGSNNSSKPVNSSTAVSVSGTQAKAIVGSAVASYRGFSASATGSATQSVTKSDNGVSIKA